MLRLLLGLTFLPLTSLAADLDSYVNAFYLAEVRLAELDEQIATEARAPRPGLLGRSRAYRDLLALRIVMEKKAREISAEYSVLARGTSSELIRFHDRLDRLDPAERLALNDLVLNLPAPPGRSLPVFYAGTTQYLEAKAAAGALIEARKRRALKDRALLRRVEAIAANAFDFGAGADSLTASGGTRPLRIRPGTGPEGTINGTQFAEKTFALTFDDGPFEVRSEQIFGHLKARGKKATFFWVMEHLEKFPGIAPKAKEAGFPLNNHSWTHVNLNMAEAATLTKEITKSTEEQAEVYGEKPRFFRLPYGAGLSNQAVRKLIADNGMIHVLWNIDSLDWQDKDPAKILARVKQLMASEKRGIILMHDIHAQTVEAAKALLEWSATLDGKPEAHRWVTIPEIVDELNKREEISVLGPELPTAPARKKRSAKNRLETGAKL